MYLQNQLGTCATYFLRVRKQYCDAVEILLFHRGPRYVDLFKKARNSKSLKLAGVDC